MTQQQRASGVLSSEELAQFERDQVTFARAGGRNETAIRVARELQRARAAIRELRDTEYKVDGAFDAAWDALMACLPPAGGEEA